MRITYYGHSCFLVQVGNKKLLFDPFISGNPQTKSAKIDLETIKPDYILLSHGHGDHLADVLEIAIQSRAKIIAVYEVAEWFEKQGLEVLGMNTGGKCKFDFGVLKMVNAVHSSSMPDGSYGGNPVGFVISNDISGTFYFAGDTALTMDMKLIPMMCPRLDFAILPIGDYFTMGYDDAVLASNFIQCNTIIGCHFDTFPAIKLDHSAAKKAFSTAGKTLFLPEIGMSFNIKKKTN
ncbi:MAG: Unknown protein [uncultured Aureispira sp.]|uniref:UPF0173 metal-dependent hydrolase HELGO_WM19061 n=1 Tax=uncultured Aureispira sp. TaxID=1331704 RepID=A0A6S6TYK5_9BACT|nr:MAG: Unknown protein [uncultured Aureispira sp.]